MPDKFDPYREALVVETATVWPEEVASTIAADRARLEQCLHAAPQQAAQIDYIRLYSGFCRQITVASADLERLIKQAG